MGSARFTKGILVSSLILIGILLSVPPIFAEETSGTENAAEQNAYDWTVLFGESLLNDPIAAKILKNIEISKQKLHELQNPQVIKTENQKFIDQQRELVNQRLQEELERMHDKYQDFTPRAAFAKYVSKQPPIYHDYYWSLFNYLEKKVTTAREHRDKILENGGTFRDAQLVFIEYAKMPMAERIDYHNKMVVKYGLMNKISDIDDFKALPPETISAFTAYAKQKNYALSGSADPLEVEIHDETEFFQIASPTTIQAVESVSFSSVSQQKEVNTFAFDTGLPVNSVEKMQLSTYATNLEPLSSTSMNFAGNQYVKKEINSMDKVSEFTLSAWVKPDYSQGSAEFTILSKEKAFSLTINNNKWPQKVVRFSIFDGIKWTMIESASLVQEEWTHVAATLDGSSMNLYINGNLEASKAIAGIPTMNTYGFLEPQAIDTISSTSEVLIGAQQTTKRGEIKSNAFFSGTVDEVVIEDELFGAQQIVDLCEQSQYYEI